MKIAIVGHSSGIAGAELSMVSISENMLENGHNVHLVIPEFGEITKKLQHSLSSGLKIHIKKAHWWMSRRGRTPIGLIRLILVTWDVIAFYGFLSKLKPDLVLTISSVTPAPFIAAKLLGIPNILTLGETVKSNPTLKSILPKRLILKIIDICTDKVVACSHFAAGEYGLDSEVLYPAIEADHTRWKNFRALYKTSSRQSKTFEMCLIGNVSEEKGHFLSLAVARRLKDEAFDFSLKIFGGGTSFDIRRLKSEIISLGLANEVSFYGPVEDSVSAFAGSDVALVLSGAEAFGKITVEALLSGTPVIGVNFGGTKEILVEGGGILVERTVEQISGAIVSLANNPTLLAELRTQIESNSFVIDQIPNNRKTLPSVAFDLLLNRSISG